MKHLFTSPPPNSIAFFKVLSRHCPCFRNVFPPFLLVQIYFLHQFLVKKGKAPSIPPSAYNPIRRTFWSQVNHFSWDKMPSFLGCSTRPSMLWRCLQPAQRPLPCLAVCSDRFPLRLPATAHLLFLSRQSPRHLRFMLFSLRSLLRQRWEPLYPNTCCQSYFARDAWSLAHED